ncbi:50S ribosomal protein L5 [Candidatus Uhrbacteria bacterium RIFCSPHIGHO2_02_FULL_54_11]|nr:MAG: 50S ribosomal protein L5 [Candidatus Uhrbacteria bacterium RIFCSPHIGHO2_02_FULL_54_11]
MTTLREQFSTTGIKGLQKELGLSNIHEVPTPLKVTVNVGMSKGLKDARYMETVEETLRRITGQKPVMTKARLSIANFKIREGMVIGMKVTLHGKRMWDFLDKVVRVSFPRVRDFRGIPVSTVDESGNLSVGFREHMAFPEIRSDEIELIHGLQVTITTSARTREKGLALFRSLGFPFQRS